jgi:DNA-binding winged helix-turn-helix (wHTH) protein
MFAPSIGMADRDVSFAQFRCDTANQCLWRGARMIPLTPKSYAVLRCLLARPGRLVSKHELLDAVWPDAVVSDASLKVCIREIRRALGDRVAAPRFIATVHRRGYRFIGAVEAGAAPVPSAPPRTSPLVGRDRALAVLQARLRARVRRTAPDHLRHRRARHRQDRAGGDLSGAHGGTHRRGDRARTLPGALRAE